MITEKTGNIFTTKCQTIVNTVNCVGVMGAGIAYECRLRYPEMYQRYVKLCNQQLLDIGKLWLYTPPNNNEKWILNFPTKSHWKYESKPEYLEKGLQKFVETYKEKKISSISFPLLGATNGGIPENVSLNIMQQYLKSCNDIEIEIYHYDPLAYDDLFLNFKKLWNEIPEKELSQQSKLRIDFVSKVKVALNDDEIRSLNKLLSVQGIGAVTLEKSFQFINNYKELRQNTNIQSDLFNYQNQQ
jgi:O-acetyl-ADP-ribose deacetylase (regulator of RNase III)